MISRDGNVDWEALVERAAATHQTVRLRAALDYLAGLPNAAFPTDVCARLATLPVTRRERLAFRWASGWSPLLGQLPTIAADYLAVTRDRSPLGTLAGLPGHLRIAGVSRTSGSSPRRRPTRCSESQRAPPGVATKPVNRISLTFDDGPGPCTAPILDLLAAHGGRATFFVIGSFAKKQRDLLRRMAAEGHEVGNHSWSHTRLADSGSRRVITRELSRTNKLLTKVLGAPPRRFRGTGVQRRRACADDRLRALAPSHTW